MNMRKPLTLITWMLIAATLLSVAFAISPLPAVSADDKQEATQLVEKAQFALESFMADSNMDAFHDLLKQAKGVFIAPQLLKGAFVIGVSGGSGVFFAWDDRMGRWNGPAFYTTGGASFGLQIGGQASEVILLAMTERGVSSFRSSSFKLGGDAGVAAGPVGIGVSAATANLSADILSFSRSKGLYGGISLDGAVVATRGDWNSAYYDKVVEPGDILTIQTVTNPQAAGLIQAVTKATGKK
jgi:lipid-binding SYLF domain-containing protein